MDTSTTVLEILTYMPAFRVENHYEFSACNGVCIYRDENY